MPFSQVSEGAQEAPFGGADVLNLLHQLHLISDSTQVVDIGGSLQSEIVGERLVKVVSVIGHLLLTSDIHRALLQ